MRKSLAALLSAVAFTFGASIGAVAQTPTSTVRGQIVDAGGRGATGMRVELVSNRLVVATTVSATDGHFSFGGVPAGNYVVRTTVNGQPTGVRVSATAGSVSASALVVLPSMATAAPAVVLAAVAPALGAVVSTAVTTVANVVVVQAAKGKDQEVVAANIAAANALIVQLNETIPRPPGQPPIPLFNFIPTVPASGTQ